MVIEYVEKREIEEANKPRIKGKNQLLIRKVFTQLRGEGIGNPNPGGPGWPEPRTFWVISEETVKDHFVGKVSSVANPRSTYKQSIEALIGAGHLVQNEGFVWFTDKDGKCKNQHGEE